MRRPRIDEQVRQRVLELDAHRLTYKVIALRMEMSASTVKKILTDAGRAHTKSSGYRGF